MAFSYDFFGRLQETSRNHDPYERFVYHPLSVEAFDAAQLALNRDKPPFGTIYKRDGHGRPEAILRRIENDEIITHVDRLPTGEPFRFTYFHKADPSRIIHELDIDSLGRLIQSFEPNSTLSTASVRNGRQFAWDAGGNLIGEADARGCGRNYFYDALGRLVGEDWSPCTRTQPPYSAPTPLGQGLEVSYRYDSYEPGQLGTAPNFIDDARYAIGRLTAVRDRGAWTQLSYDARGRVRRMTRTAASPSGPGSAKPYIDYGFMQLRDFNLSDQLIKQTTGAPKFGPGRTEGFVEFDYSPRGALLSVRSAYGALINAVSYRNDGLLKSITLGDLANTELAYSYDTYSRRDGYRYERSAPALWATSVPGYEKPPNETAISELANVSAILDPVGNPITIKDTYAGSWPVKYSPPSVKLRYDSLYRVRRLDYDPQLPWSPAFEHEFRNGDRGPLLPLLTTKRPQQIAFSYDWNGNTVEVSDDAKLVFDRSLLQVTNGDASGKVPHQLRTANGIRARYDAAGNLVELTVERPGRCMWSSCAQRFVYDWDEVGYLIRARRWDFVGNKVPTETPNWPDVPDKPPTRDLSFVYSQGERILRKVTDETGVARYDLAIFDTMTLADVKPNATNDGYLIDLSNVRVRLADFARIVYAPGLPSAPGSTSDGYRVFLELKDGLGSSAITLDRETSEVVERIGYTPYGGVENYFRPDRWIAAPQRPVSARYTGKTLDAEVGLINFGARYLHTHLGRWMSPDPLVQVKAIEDGNPYQFVGGRLFTDPTGLAPEELPPCGSSPCTLPEVTIVGQVPGKAPDTEPDDMQEVTVRGPPRAPKDIPGPEALTYDEYNITLRQTVIGIDPYNPDESWPDALYRARGKGHWEKKDVTNFAKGAWNLGASAVNFVVRSEFITPMPIDFGHEKAAWGGSEFASALALEGSAKLIGVMWRSATAPGRVLFRGSTANLSKGTTLPRNLREQLAIEQAMSDPHGGLAIPELIINDRRWGKVWVKMQQKLDPGGGGGPINVHYLWNRFNGALDDFKIVLPGSR